MYVSKSVNEIPHIFPFYYLKKGKNCGKKCIILNIGKVVYSYRWKEIQKSFYFT